MTMNGKAMAEPLNLRGPTLVMARVRKEISLPEARAQLHQTKAPTCRVGRYGVCSTHGQPIEDCE